MKFSSKVPTNIKAGTSIIDYLSARFTYHTRQEWETNVRNGKIQVEDKCVSPHFIVKSGLTLLYDAGEFDEPAADLDYHIIYEDNWFLGVNKPGNLLVHRAGKSFRNNLTYQLRFINVPPFPDIHPTHRIDRDTSGIVLFAKNPEARAVMSNSFADQKVNKLYRAIVHGVVDRTIKVIDAPIGKAQNSSISYKFQVEQNGKSALTELIDMTPVGDKFSLLTLKPLTGRTHQIRIHCEHIGHPIVGDKLYGLSETEYLRWRDQSAAPETEMLFYRHALHCAMMEFDHPFDKRMMRLEAPLPKDMLDLLELLSN
ncbi:MAG: RluA family pseudouridine synthase [Chitinispirillaceae bacterium]|nr:RluA family pseudouridine synthase [Chitinispirillaceae bacterium]